MSGGNGRDQDSEQTNVGSTTEPINVEGPDSSNEKTIILPSLKIGETLNELNPTGGIFVDYSPETRANAPLGDNITTLDKTMGGNPDSLITVYRGVSSGQHEIVPGDFITTNYQLAKDYAGNDDILEKTVRLGDVLDAIDEPLGEEYLYRPGADSIVLK